MCPDSENNINLVSTITKSISDFFGNANAFCTGIISSIVGYFVPVKNIVHVLIIFFIVDMIFGFLAAKKGKMRKGKEKECKNFSVAIIWNTTIPRMLISIILVMAAFMWDTTYNQELINTYKAIGWFISGVLIFSIAENAFIITKWGIFLKVREFIRSKIKQETQQDAEVTENIEKEHKRLLKGGKRKEAENDTI
jgi:hypothetical protein